MKQYQKISLNCICILFLMTMVGCVPLFIGAAAGAGGVSYVRGALVRNIDERVKPMHKAVLAALKDLNYFVSADELNKHSAYIKAEYKDGKKIRIHIDALSEYVSKITIRVGSFGNQEKSLLIMNAIEKKL